MKIQAAAATALCAIGCLAPFRCGAQEFRGIWADTFHAGMRNGSEVSAMVNAARAAHCNALVVEVRKRGDAYYRNGLEPVATGVAAGFDPLADLLAKAHDTSGGKQRIEVHAWLVTYNIWNHETNLPPQATHPYRLHPEWVSHRYRANQSDPDVTWAGTSASSGNYFFDPGHPDVQQHTFEVTMDILKRYDIDGINFDYIRYPDPAYWGGASAQPWGYHPVAVARFNAASLRSGIPAPDDADWMQWRRDQVTALLRKVYLHAWALKPHVRITADTIAYNPAPAGISLAAWRNTSAYRAVLQDWRSWMDEGILDLACPMLYRRQSESAASFSSWAGWIARQQFSRASAIGLGWYLNPADATLEQIEVARSAGTSTLRSAGVLGYSYAVFDNSGDNGTSARNAFAAALVSGENAPFAERAEPPGMPWKSDESSGHLMGTAFADDGETPLDGATIAITGPVSRSIQSDGTGFFGAVGLPPGNYTLTLQHPDGGTTLRTAVVTGAGVTAIDLQPDPPVVLPFEITDVTRDPQTGALTVTWNAEPGRRYRLERSIGLHTWAAVATGLTTAGDSISHSWTPSAALGPSVFVRAAAEDP